MASIRKRGDKWQVQIRRQGYPPLSRSFIRKAEAQEWARITEIEADRQELAPDRKLLDRITLGELVERYRDQVAVNKKGAEIEGFILNAFLRHPVCKKPLSRITPADFATYRDERLTSISAKSLKRQLSPLHNMFEVAMREWQLPIRENPIDKIRLDVRDNRRARRLKDDEFQRLVQAAKTRKNPLILPIILFALETAMRRGEILAMLWGHIDWKRSSVLIPEAKNGYQRTIPLTKSALALLNGLRPDGAGEKVRVFPTTPVALRLAWDRLTDKGGLEDLHFHDLRHEAISRLFELGLTAPEVAAISGHRDARMLLRYAHADLSAIHRKLRVTELQDTTSCTAT